MYKVMWNFIESDVMKKILLILFCCLTVTAHAVEVHGLATATVPVTNQSAAERSQAVTQALQQVLIKLTGNSQINDNKAIQANLQNAQDYLQQYGYQRVKLPDAKQALALTASFDMSALKKLIAQSGQSVWGNNRPLVLIWLAVKQKQQQQISQYIVASNGASIAEQLVQHDAKMRGLPIMLPILDLQDLQQITINDITKQNINALSQASRRYGSDAILIAYINEQGQQQWQGNWNLLVAGQSISWTNQQATLDAVIDAGINNLADTLAQRYAVLGIQQDHHNVSLTITNIKSLNDYAQVMKYLRQLSVVKNLTVTAVEPDQIVFDLQVIGGQRALTQAINLDHTLQPIVMSDAALSNQTGLYYQWLS